MFITTIKKLSITPRYLVKLRRDAVGGRVRVGLVQQRLDGGEDGGDVVGGGPAVLQDVQADPPVSVHVRVEHLADKPDTHKMKSGYLTRQQTYLVAHSATQYKGLCVCVYVCVSVCLSVPPFQIKYFCLTNALFEFLMTSIGSIWL